MARTGLRMMPTFPSSSLRCRKARFPRYGSKAGLSDSASPDRTSVKLAPSIPSRDQVCLHPSCSPRQHALRSESEATCSVEAPPCERQASLYSRGPRSGSGYAVPSHQRLLDPIRPTRGHSTTSSHGDLYVLPSLCGSATRVVPRFCLSILPSMSSSTSPGSRPLHPSSSFAVHVCLRRGVIGSALPMLAISGLTGSPLL